MLVKHDFSQINSKIPFFPASLNPHFFSSSSEFQSVSPASPGGGAAHCLRGGPVSGGEEISHLF